jgi:hypothetical protein
LKLCNVGSACKWNQLVEGPQNKGKRNVVGELTAGNHLAFDASCCISTNLTQCTYRKRMMWKI